MGSILAKRSQNQIHADAISRKAMSVAGDLSLDGPDDPYHPVDIVRVLASVQQDISNSDMSQIFENLQRDPDLLDFMLSLESVQYELVNPDQEEKSYPALGAALKAYGSHVLWGLNKDDSAGGEATVRKLIRMGVNVHAPIPRRCTDNAANVHLEVFGTPLDELLNVARETSDARIVADAWLNILCTEGHDVRAYLKREQLLHGRRCSLTYSNQRYPDRSLPRRLIFNFGKVPTFYTDWWVDPKSEGFLVCHEFRVMANMIDMIIRTEVETMLIDQNMIESPEYDAYIKSWQRAWPVTYAAWSKPTWSRRERARAQGRANRRWRKKALKAEKAKAKGTRDQTIMPGAWPGQ